MKITPDSFRHFIAYYDFSLSVTRRPINGFRFRRTRDSRCIIISDAVQRIQYTSGSQTVIREKSRGSAGASELTELKYYYIS